ncbi:MAG TPA: hypothetical protein VMU17_03430, partial [Elusimicrobiota bacterium]|nr:hypothetical protein [Elusimicrobiota bacterium]
MALVDRSMDESLRTSLIVSALGQGYCYYGELCKRFGVREKNPEQEKSLRSALGRITKSEHRLHRPLLWAVVIRRQDALPDPGFFELAKSLGKFKGGHDPLE